jgi:hypothetical protein
VACRNQSVTLSFESDEGVASNWKIFRSYPWQSPRQLAAPYQAGVEFWWVGRPGVQTTVQLPPGVAEGVANLRHGQILLLRYEGGYDLTPTRVRLLTLGDRAGIAATHKNGVPIVVWAPGGGDVMVAMEVARSLERNVRLEQRAGDFVLAGQAEVPCSDFGQYQEQGSITIEKPIWPWLVAILGVLGAAVVGVSIVRSKRRREVIREEWVTAGVGHQR